MSNAPWKPMTDQLGESDLIRLRDYIDTRLENRAMTDDTYNGWANRETWAVALYVNNDQRWQESVLDALREAVGEVIVGDSGYEYADVPLKDWEAGAIVKEMIEELAYHIIDEPETTTRELRQAFEDIGSLWRVDWDALGAAFLADIAEDAS